MIGEISMVPACDRTALFGQAQSRSVFREKCVPQTNSFWSAGQMRLKFAATKPMWRNGRRNGLKIRWAVTGPCRFESGHRQFCFCQR